MTAPPARSMDATEWALLLALSVLWGGSFFFVEVALGGLPPLTLALLRVAIAAAALRAAAATLAAISPARTVPATAPRHAASPPSGTPAPRPTGRPWAAFAVMGLLNNVVPFGLIFWAQQHLTGGLAAILNATTPLWGVLLAHVVLSDERLTPNRLAGVLTGLAGVAVMVGPAAPGDLGAAAVPAQVAVLLAAVSYACAGLYGRRLKSLPPAEAAAGQLTASTVLLLAPVALLERPWTLSPPGAGALTAVLGLALLSTALAYTLYFRLLRTAGATNLLLVTLLIPATALLLGSLVLAEPLETGQLAGMALIGLGLALIDGRPLRHARAALGRAG